MRAAVFSLALALVAMGLSGMARAQEGAAQPAATIANGFRAQAVPAYEGRLRQGQTMPMVLHIENRGGDAGGEVVVVDSRTQAATRYPVALPQGAKKDVPFVLPSGALFEVTLSTTRGLVPITVLPATGIARASLLVVGDDPGGYGFLGALAAPKAKAPPGTYGEPPSAVAVVAYLRPEAFPDGEAALDRTSCVALGTGSERLGAPALAAIRRYVLRGGHLVLIGGASAPILSDARLRDLVPYSALTPAEVEVRGQRVSAQLPTAISSAEATEFDGVPVVRRAYGVGRVSMFAADPTDGPFRNVSGRARLVANALDLQRSTIMASTPISNGPAFSGSGTPSKTIPGEVDPFSLPIPPTITILYVLGAYFLVVLPVNFLILRAMRRLELAWFTAPLVALGFAGVLFRNAGSLYNTGLSHTATTVVFADSGAREGFALGKSQIFFPSAARGPIPITGAEAIGTTLFQTADDYSYSRRENARPLDVIVTDHPAVPDYGSTALEFRDLDYHQTLDLGNGVRVVESKDSSGPTIEVLNGSPYTLREVTVVRSGQKVGRGLDNVGGTANSSLGALIALAPIEPGARAVLKVGGTLSVAGLNAVLWSSAPLLVASVDEAPVGPQLGTLVHGRSWTRLIVSGERR